MPRAGERRSLFLLARHGNRDVLSTNDLVVGRIKSVPARAGNVDFGPSMRGAVLTFAHLDVASANLAPNPQCRAPSIMSTAKSRHDPLPSVRVSCGNWTPGSSRRVYLNDSWMWALSLCRRSKVLMTCPGR